MSDIKNFLILFLQLFNIPLYEHVCSVTKSCLTFSDPMDCSLPGSSVHGIFQARILEGAAINHIIFNIPLLMDTKVAYNILMLQKCCNSLYANKMDNLEEMDKFREV